MTDAVRTDPQPPQAGDQYVQSLARGLAVIRAFDADRPVMTRRTGADTCWAGVAEATATPA